MATETHVHDGSAYRKLKQWHVHDGSAWRDLKQVYCHDGTAWRKVFQKIDWNKIGNWTGIRQTILFNGEIHSSTTAGVYKYTIQDGWVKLGSGFDGSKSLVESSGALYASFNTTSTPGVRQWNGSTWINIGTITGVNHINFIDGSLYAATELGVYIWSGSTWNRIGTTALWGSKRIEKTGGQLLAITDNSGINFWNGSDWQQLGDRQFYGINAVFGPFLNDNVEKYFSSANATYQLNNGVWQYVVAASGYLLQLQSQGLKDRLVIGEMGGDSLDVFIFNYLNNTKIRLGSQASIYFPFHLTVLPIEQNGNIPTLIASAENGLFYYSDSIENIMAIM